MAIICHCEAVRERAIVKAIHHGARSLPDLRDACGAAARCGGCEPAVLDLLERHTTSTVGLSSRLGLNA